MRYALLASMLMTTTAWGASVGPDGIHSLHTGLRGAGVLIGQAELGRSGKAGYDAANFSASNTVPAGVYFQNDAGMDPPDTHVTFHATLVAQVMIGGPGLYSGVAPEAELHSIGISDLNDDVQVALALNRLALLNGGTVSAINLSFYGVMQFLEGPNGESHFTQFVDWSARQHDVLYVVAWGNFDSEHEFRKPVDNFNGMTVAASERVDAGPYRKFSATNKPETDITDYQQIDILAPGQDILLLAWSDLPTFNHGTSFAAPHVIGTAALLQQYARNKSRR